MGGGKAAKQKGDRLERGIVALLQDAGFQDAQRVPNSGSSGGRFSDDIQMTWFSGEVAKFECKARKGGDGFALLYRWISGCSGLFIKADRKPTLVVLPVNDFLDLLKRAHPTQDGGDQ